MPHGIAHPEIGYDYSNTTSQRQRNLYTRNSVPKNLHPTSCEAQLDGDARELNKNNAQEDERKSGVEEVPEASEEKKDVVSERVRKRILLTTKLTNHSDPIGTYQTITTISKPTLRARKSSLPPADATDDLERRPRP